MNLNNDSIIHDKQSVLQILVDILTDMTSEWDMDSDDPVGNQTKLIEDLGFESIDVVQFVVAIEEHYQTKELPFEKLLMVDDRYVDEIVVEDVVEFLCRHLNKTPKGD